MVNEIKIGHFDKNISYNFLKSGFEEAELNVNDNDLNSAIDVLDGIAGWLTYYGYNRTVRKLNNLDSINNVIEYSKRLIDSELNKLINNSKDRYMAIMEAVAAGLNNWTTVKGSVIHLFNNNIPFSRPNRSLILSFGVMSNSISTTPYY